MKKTFLRTLSILLATALLVGTMLPLGLTSALTETDSSIIMNWGDFSQNANSFSIESAAESGNPGIALKEDMTKNWLVIKNSADWTARGVNESFTGDKTLNGTVDFSFTFKYTEDSGSMRFLIFADAAAPTTANLALKIHNGSIGLYRNPAGSNFNADKELIGNTLPFTANNSPYRVRVIIDNNYINVSVTPLSIDDATTATADEQSFIVPKDPAINSFTGGIYGVAYHIGFFMTDTCVSLPSSMQQHSSYYKNWGDFTDTPDNYFTNGNADGVTVDKVTDNNASWLRIYGAGNTQTIIPQSFSEAKVLSDNFNWDFTLRAGPYAYHYSNFYMLDEYGTGENCYYLQITNGENAEDDIANERKNIKLYRRKSGESDVLLGETYCAGITDSNPNPYRFNIAVTEETINIKITNSSDPTDAYTITGTRDPEDNFAGGLYFGRYNGTVRLTDMQVYTNTVYSGNHWGDFSAANTNGSFTSANSTDMPIKYDNQDNKNWIMFSKTNYGTIGINESFTGNATLSGTFDMSFIMRAGPNTNTVLRLSLFSNSSNPTNDCYVLKISAGGKMQLYRKTAATALAENANLLLSEMTVTNLLNTKPHKIQITATGSAITVTATELTASNYTANGSPVTMTAETDTSICNGGIHFSNYYGTVRLTDMQISSENALVSHNHTYNTTDLNSDYHSHFQSCECGAIKDIETHTFAYKSTGIESCSDCGYDTVVNVDKGNCNGDNYVNICDLVTMSDYETQLSTKINLHNADCDGDGKYTGSLDMIALKQILLSMKDS